MSLAPETVETLCRYWTDRLGVDRGAFDRDGVTIGRTGSEDAADVELFRRNDALVVGAPAALADSLRGSETRLADLDFESSTAARDVLTEVVPVERVHGPAFYGYTDADAFDPVEVPARPLTEADREAFEAFRGTVSTEDWVNGGPAFRPGRTVGRFGDGGELVAAAGFEVWDGRLAHVAVVTRPDARDEGYGRAVVSRATELALAAGLQPQYRTLDEWPWSVALAAELGYERFATSLFVETG